MTIDFNSAPKETKMAFMETMFDQGNDNPDQQDFEEWCEIRHAWENLQKLSIRLRQKTNKGRDVSQGDQSRIVPLLAVPMKESFIPKSVEKLMQKQLKDQTFALRQEIYRENASIQWEDVFQKRQSLEKAKERHLQAQDEHDEALKQFKISNDLISDRTDKKAHKNLEAKKSRGNEE